MAVVAPWPTGWAATVEAGGDRAAHGGDDVRGVAYLHDGDRALVDRAGPGQAVLVPVGVAGQVTWPGSAPRAARGPRQWMAMCVSFR